MDNPFLDHWISDPVDFLQLDCEFHPMALDGDDG